MKLVICVIEVRMKSTEYSVTLPEEAEEAIVN